MRHNSTEVGGSPERHPSSAPDVDTLQAAPNPITAAAPGLKRASGEGGKSSQQQSHSEYASIGHGNKPRCELLMKTKKDGVHGEACVDGEVMAWMASGWWRDK